MAIHESAHALAALEQGIPLFEITIQHPEGGATWMDTAALHRDPEADLFICAAGREAELMLIGPSGGESFAHRTDYDRAERAATRYAAAVGDENAGPRMMSGVRGDAVEFIRRYANLILSLADELGRRGSMSGAEVEQFATGGQPGMYGPPVDPNQVFPPMGPSGNLPDNRQPHAGQYAAPDEHLRQAEWMAAWRRDQLSGRHGTPPGMGMKYDADVPRFSNGCPIF